MTVVQSNRPLYLRYINELPSGDKIEYVVDSEDRGIGKKVDGVKAQDYLQQSRQRLGGMGYWGLLPEWKKIEI